MVRIRNIATGEVLELGYGYAVELLDLQKNPALIIIPNAQQQCVDIVSSSEDPVKAENYAKLYGLKLSTTMMPAKLPTPSS